MSRDRLGMNVRPPPHSPYPFSAGTYHHLYPQTNGLSSSEPYDPPFSRTSFSNGSGGGNGKVDGDLEMQQVGHSYGGGGDDGEMEKFNEEVISIQSQLKTLNSQISQLSNLQSQLLSTTAASSTSSSLESEISHLTTLTSTLSNSIKNRIKSLATSTARSKSPNKQTQQLQISLLRKRFLETIENYQQVEKQNRDKIKSRLERQVRIVNPDATEEEVRRLVEEGGEGEGVFAQALVEGRQAEAGRVLGEVRDRQKELKRLEGKLIELAELFNEMSIALDEQGEQLEEIEEKQNLITEDVGATVGILNKGKTSALNYRRGRVICFGITVGVIIVVAIVVAVVVLQNKKK